MNVEISIGIFNFRFSEVFFVEVDIEEALRLAEAGAV